MPLTKPEVVIKTSFEKFQEKLQEAKDIAKKVSDALSIETEE